MKKIGILGSGAVAKALAEGFLKNGYEVMLGTSNSSKLDEWKLGVSGSVSVGSFEQAAEFGGIIVLAVKGEGAKDVLQSAKHINGKTIIDATNPIDSSKPPVNGVLSYFTDMNESLMEGLQKHFPDANFVKCFNSISSGLMVDPKLPGGVPTMFICGNNTEAKNEVLVILDQFNWEVNDMGHAEAARAIEPLCMLWCIPGFLSNDWVHGFKMVR